LTKHLQDVQKPPERKKTEYEGGPQGKAVEMDQDNQRIPRWPTEGASRKEKARRGGGFNEKPGRLKYVNSLEDRKGMQGGNGKK